MKRKLLSVLLTGAMVLSLAACGNDSGESGSAGSGAEGSSSAQPESSSAASQESSQESSAAQAEEEKITWNMGAFRGSGSGAGRMAPDHV